MTNKEWEKLLDVINGKIFTPLPVGFIIDSPWLAGWAGMSVTDYLSSEEMWFDANLKAIKTFPGIMFLPGFWMEFGMCTEPSAFGVKCIWPEDAFPHMGKLFHTIEECENIDKPNPKTDGMLPFVIKRLQHCQSKIEGAGHSIRFATSRGPLNLAISLMDDTEFLLAIKTNPEAICKYLSIITDFIIDWLEYQITMFPSIDGIMLLDDIVGFIGEDDFKQIALPYLKKIFQYFDVKVKCFHNDAEGLICAPYLPDIGVNLFNFSFNHSIPLMKKMTNNAVTLLGNIPPLQVLLNGTVDEVVQNVRDLVTSLDEKSHIILSSGGGVSPAVTTENIRAFYNGTI